MSTLSRRRLLSCLGALLSATAARADGAFIEQIPSTAWRTGSAVHMKIAPVIDPTTTGSLAERSQTAAGAGLPANVNLFTSSPADLQPQIYQDGFGRRLAGSASGAQSSVSITQTGLYETMAILQDGARNSLTVSQEGRGHSLAVTQVGNGQVLTASQSGFNNVMAAQQSGASNMMAVTQGGASNTLNASQSGTGNRLVGFQR